MSDKTKHQLGIITKFLIKTSQVTSYRTNDDGAVQAGVSKRFFYTDPITSEATNVATDANTGLQWIRDHTLLTGAGGATGGNQNLSGAMGWTTAIDRCNALIYNGHSDWRLPNAVEIATLAVIEATNGAPFVDRNVFKNVFNGDYWASTTQPSSTGNAFRLATNIGLVGITTKTSNCRVIPVRGGIIT
jgi:hypothetical protein